MSLSDISASFTEATLDAIIQKAGGTKHTSYKLDKVFKKGDSYLSNVFRLYVHGINEGNGATQELNLIVKGMPDNLARRKVFRSAVFFRNEINFYANVVPAWQKLQSEQKAKNPFTEYPICYAYHCDGESDFVVLQDVSFLGYTSPKRQDYITLEEGLLTMRTLGRFHGVSLALNAIQPDEFEKAANSLQETYYTEKIRPGYIDFLRVACNVARDAVSKTYPNSKYEAIANNFLQESSLFDDLIQLVSTRSKLSVLGNGDCWTPNFLTRYSGTGKPEAIIIIDFQLARCASLALDLMYFIYSCTSQDLREKHYEELLQEYHHSATSLIADLGADPEKVFSWQDLLDELQQFARFGCGTGIEAVPVSLKEENELADLDEIEEHMTLADVWNIKPFEDPKKRERLAAIFKHAIDEGYIK